MKLSRIAHTCACVRIAFVFWAALLAVLSAVSVSALPSFGVDCRGCHTTVRNGMAITDFQSQTNLLKVFQVTAGQTAVIRFSVTNNYGGNYGLGVSGLDSAGINSSAHHMTFTPDATWTSQSSGAYFTVGPTSTNPKLWSFNLAVGAETAADYYPVEVQLAGKGSVGRWSQVESFYVQVVSAAPPQPTILAPRRIGSAFSVDVATTSGFTYFLEHRTSPATGSWTVVDQTTGSGAIKTLTDSAAVASQGFYHIRVQ